MNDHFFPIEPESCDENAACDTSTCESRSAAHDSAPRFQRAVRDQVQMYWNDLDSLLSEDHRARVVWEYVEGIDLAPLYDLIRAREGTVGRSPIDPKILLALWLFATLEGVGSARLLARLCREHVAYQWICGGVSINHHTLSDFRVRHETFLSQLLTVSVAAMLKSGLVEMKRVAQDGVRVRASAGTSSFRGQEHLTGLLEQAKRQVEALRAELDADPGACCRRQKAARERAARERKERLQQAKAELEKAKVTKKQGSRKTERKVRASTTDPEARKMKMANGGFNPAYNGQFAVDTETQVIVGVGVTNCGSDGGQLVPMLEQMRQRYGRLPEEILVDGGFATKQDIERVSSAEFGCTVYAPVQRSRGTPGEEAFLPRAWDSAAIATWRERMGTQEAKAIYKERASTVECVNAQARNRGLQRLLVRGLGKARSVLLWFALAHNLMRVATLQAAN